MSLDEDVPDVNTSDIDTSFPSLNSKAQEDSDNEVEVERVSKSIDTKNEGSADNDIITVSDSDFEVTDSVTKKVNLRKEICEGRGSRLQKVRALGKRLEKPLKDIEKLISEKYVMEEVDYFPRENVTYGNYLKQLGLKLSNLGSKVRETGEIIIHEQETFKASRVDELDISLDIKQEKERTLDSSDSGNESTSIGTAVATDESSDSTIDISSMKAAIRLDKKGGKHKCSECDDNFPNKADLRSHKQRVHLDIKFRCTRYNCTFVGSSENSYKRHIITHNGKIFQCSKCTKSYNSRSSLTNHKKIHSGLQYQCTVSDCDKTFKSESGFKNHVKYFHSKGLKYKCTIGSCKSKFRTPNYLRAHVIKVHNKLSSNNN